jgi:hypothetical protein
MSGEGTSTGTRVELYARESLPEAAMRRRDRVAGALSELAESGHVAQVEIHTWATKVPVDGDSTELDRYERFRAWTEDVGVELEPFFDTRQCYSMETGERGEQLVLPALCLAVYRDDRLQSVYPHSTNDGSRSVMDCLRAIESARRRTPGQDSTDRTARSDSQH